MRGTLGTEPFRIRYAFLLLLVFPSVVEAERPPLKTHTTADGLAHDRVRRIVSDSRGFLWLCTPRGLNRFDGYRFVTYGPSDGLPVTSINDLVETSSGAYWVATNDGGVSRFNVSATRNLAEQGDGSKRRVRDAAPSRFTVFRVGEGPETNRVNVLYEDRGRRLWAGTDGGLFSLEERKGQAPFQRVELGLPSHPDRAVQVWAFVEDREGSLWIGSSWGLVRRLPDGRLIHYVIELALANHGSDNYRCPMALVICHWSGVDLPHAFPRGASRNRGLRIFGLRIDCRVLIADRGLIAGGRSLRLMIAASSPAVGAV